MNASAIIALAERCALVNPPISILLVSPDAGLAAQLAALAGVELDHIADAASADDIAIGRRADLGIVSGQLERMRPADGIALLCRMRDCNCDRILLDPGASSPDAGELRSLGFYPCETLPGSGHRLFGYDRDSYFEPREWNTPEHWAHPENFHKRRW